MSESPAPHPAPEPSFLNRVIRFCIENPLIVILLVLFFFGWGLYVMPFEWDARGFPTNPVPVDAIPDIGENQQIVFTEWPGRSPQDIEDQITYPMTIAMLAVPGVEEVRSFSMFGFSSVNVIFKEEVDFYWSRSRILEKLAVAQKDLPEGVVPELGPDATGLGQVFWYTLEGEEWGLEELRSIQDWVVRYALQSADGISEVASVGGHVREYQVDVDPDAMRAHRVTLGEIAQAVKNSNIDVGARTIEVNQVEYVVRGLGYLRSVDDLLNTVIKESENVPIYIRNIANVTLGPALRRGVLDKEGVEAVGGVAVVRYGENPLRVIGNLKDTLDRVADRETVDGRDTWVLRGYEKTLEDGTVSKVRLVPFYDRTHLIHETLGTLRETLKEEVLTSILIVVVLLSHFMTSFLLSALLPLTILVTFILMRIFHIEANIMSLAGIAIAIGEMVDMGIIFCENIISRTEKEGDEGDPTEVVYESATEVGSAVVTAMATTIVSFLPVFVMIGAEGKLFKPLAYTKTFCLVASLIMAIAIVPCMMRLIVSRPKKPFGLRLIYAAVAIGIGVYVGSTFNFWLGLLLIAAGTYRLLETTLSGWPKRWLQFALNLAAVIVVTCILTDSWMPLGLGPGFARNLILVIVVYGSVIGALFLFQFVYPSLLRFFLSHKYVFYPIPLAILLFGLSVWLGFGRVFDLIPAVMDGIRLDGDAIRSTPVWVAAAHKFPGLGKEFMPRLDEGSFLYMPSTMPHAGIGESYDALSKQDLSIAQIPEVESVVGKIGRVDSPLDPAPIGMVETVINYKPEWTIDPETRDRTRNWRPEIETADDIWNEIVERAQVPGSTAAPKLQPIETRLVMLQTGMRAAMGVKIYGPGLEILKDLSLEIERLLKQVPLVEPTTVVADRVVGKPYLEIRLDREAIARYGVNIRDVQDVIEIAIGGMPITKTVEGRERYPVRVRYQRELRDSIEEIGRILVPTMRENGPGGMPGNTVDANAVSKPPVGPVQVPLSQLAEIEYVQGPDMIKSEDTFLVSYVTFDKKQGTAEVDVVESARDYLDAKIASGELTLPPGTNFKFAGSYENQVRAQKTLFVVIPLSLFLSFLILYLQFRTVSVTFMIFSGIVIAWAGGFLMIWLYGQGWFLDFNVFGVNMRDVFHVTPINLSVAVWVGFLALFGIAEDDGVVMATYLDQRFKETRPASIEQIREATLYAGKRRLRPCLMTTATTILGLLPVLTATGRGADVMVPMAIPAFGGMCIELITLFVVPVTYCLVQELKFKLRLKEIDL
jgi:Cu(I)/Ag(I) efflux system membrane protein CusA/SilA